MSSPAQPDAPRAMRLADILTVTDETDQKGRLLLEDSAPKRARKKVTRDGVAMKTSRCPYEDTPSRTGGLMNVSAYEALRHDTAEILNGFAWLGRHYGVVEPSNSGTVRSFFDVTYLGLALPPLLFYRAHDPVPPHGRLPTYVASIFKASRGMWSAAVDMLNKTDPPSTRVTVAQVLEFADKEGHLARQASGRVCAAPTRLIERTIAAILTGEGGDPTRSHLPELVDFATLWEFCRLQDSLGTTLSGYRAVLEELMQSGQFSGPDELFAATVVAGGFRRSFGDLTESVLRRVHAVQAGLNGLLGRADDAPAITFEELTRML